IQRLILATAIAVAAWANPSAAQPPAATPATPIVVPTDPTAVVAYVDREAILAGDILLDVEARIASAKKQIESQGKQLADLEIKRARGMLFRGMLQARVRDKMMRQAFLLKQVGTKSADQRADATKQMQTRAREAFYAERVPDIMKQLGVTTIEALNTELGKSGRSLLREEDQFLDSVLADAYRRDTIPSEPHIPLAEIIGYYDEHIDDYSRAARVRWEQLSVQFDRHPSPAAAKEKIAMMGNKVFYGGNLAAVAKEFSEEPFASGGGQHDWTSQGSLASVPLDQNLFRLPLNKLSQYIEDENGVHIVRVLERQPAGSIPLSEVQDEIKQLLQRKKGEKLQQKLVDDVASLVAVWTMFPDDIPGAMPLRR
ncbi:MAG: peptidyl-prolyl cis-trans isomerase, partial [Planctomycetota bacterium]